MPKFYFDLAEARKYLESGQTPWTPNLSAIYGLRLALHKMLEEGLENIFARHHSVAEYTRQSIVDLGLQLFCTDPKRASDSVTAIKVPENVDGSTLMSRMRLEENVVLAGGQGKLAGQIFRIGHLGWVCQEDIEEVIEALKRVLPRVGFNAG
jgi:aspartate aminotransferase-like enzyme